MAQETIVALEGHLRLKPCDATRRTEGEFAWMDGSHEERRARADRKRKLFEQIDALNADWDGPKVTSDDIVEMIHDMREERDERIMQGVAADGGAAEGDIR